MTQLSAGESFDIAATRVRMGIGWDKDRGAGVARTGRPEVDLDATGPCRPVRGVGPDGHPAHQPDQQSSRLGEVDHTQGLRERILERLRLVRWARVRGHRPPPRLPGTPAPAEHGV